MFSAARSLLICLWCSVGLVHGCISKGDTSVGEEEEKKEAKTLCEKHCKQLRDSGCGNSNCEANCTDNRASCPVLDVLMECYLDADKFECGASVAGCEQEESDFSYCVDLGGSVGVFDVEFCSDQGAECLECCDSRFADGFDSEDEILKECVCSDCTSCSSFCEDETGEVEPTQACFDCGTDCFSEYCGPGTTCYAYQLCTTECTEPRPEPEPVAEPEPDPESPVCETPSGPEPVTLASSPNLSVALRRWSQVQCAKEMRCNFLLTNIVAGDEAYCVEQLNTELSWANDLPGIGFNVESVDECAQILTDFTCDEWHGPTAECEIKGELDDGEPCIFNAQCSTGWCQSARFSCGVCAPRPEEGDACNHRSECPGGDCRDGECFPLGMVGQVCDEESPCFGSFLSCVGGVCVKSDRSVGETCGPSEDQAFCDQVNANLACNGSGVCQEATVATAGEDCPAFGWCGGSGSCVDGVCVAGPGPGDACSDEMGPYCRWPSICQDGTCKGVPEGYDCDAEPEGDPDAGAP